MKNIGNVKKKKIASVECLRTVAKDSSSLSQLLLAVSRLLFFFSLL
jgi:hypothetical protein